MPGKHSKGADETSTTADGSLQSVWRVTNLCMGVFFLLAAYANINDEDWYLWTPIYLIPSLLSLVVAVKLDLRDTKVWNLVCIIHFALCLAYAIYQGAILVEVLAGQIKNPLQHEEGRVVFQHIEMVGLFIILIWLGISRFTNVGRSNAPVTSRSLMSALMLITITLALLPLFLWSLCFVSDWHTKIGHCNGMFA